MTDTRAERFDHGWDTVNRINAPAAQRQWDALGAVYPDFARWIVESAYGDILGRPALSLRDRELATVAALTALGNAAPQLKAHVTGALNNGLSRQEICEVIMQMAIYAGVPAAINGMAAAREAFDEADA
jgi:4-carboxymuconolactone decarboxylase